MESGTGNLKLFAGPPETAELPAPPSPAPLPDPHVAATRELIRPPAVRPGRRDCEPYSAAWFDELEQKRYQRHGRWLPKALEFGRHPGESLLVLGCGLGIDAAAYARTGTSVTVATAPDERPDLIRENFDRNGLTGEFVALAGPRLPFADGAFDVVTWNALYDAAEPNPLRIDELFRVLKPGGKLIGLFPAHYDTAFWQSVLLPLQWLYWRRPADPTTAPKATARELVRLFRQFGEHRVSKRHLRRGELPYVWRLLPLVLLERIMGRVLVLKAKKPILAARLHAAQIDIGRVAA
ncbi:class I SAM-dependent methyltransferase [Gemmata sp. JC673]|uniref:Class I SAM-dependent methyltransferase n=1 Tax=Gemmata algarum TaxID=2975278 RepID=A0ABU5F5P2_9BACT|nr:class I SAM-dependent methyltransferase [Gemmata algarum]MDY3562122.1 class I SAM-dependent methyltransferase [Gemmata algarum]